LFPYKKACKIWLADVLLHSILKFRRLVHARDHFWTVLSNIRSSAPIPTSPQPTHPSAYSHTEQGNVNLGLCRLALLLGLHTSRALLQSRCLEEGEAQLIRGQIHSPRLGDIVDYGIRLSYWSPSLCILAGRYDNPVPESTIYPQSGTKNLTIHQARGWSS
jgi:hypothetical protein